MSATSLSGPIAVGILILGTTACGGGNRDASRPSVSAVSPARDSASAVITANVSASFDRAMDASTIDTATFVVTGPSGDLTGTVRYDTDTDTAVFDPLSELEVGERYTASIARTVRDALGQTLGTDVIWPFQTGGRMVRVSVNADGVEADGCSFDPSVSGSGGFVAFDSAADNLVPGDTLSTNDAFVKAVATDEILRISVAEDGLTQADAGSFNASISADGRYIGFESDAGNLVLNDVNGLRDIFRAFNELF